MVMPVQLRDAKGQVITQRVVLKNHAGKSPLESSIAVLFIFNTHLAPIRRIEIERDRITLVVALQDVEGRDQDRWLDELRTGYEDALNRAALQRVVKIDVHRENVDHTSETTSHHYDGRVVHHNALNITTPKVE